MDSTIPEAAPKSWLDKPVLPYLPKIKIEHLIIAAILILAVISRLYMLGVRSMDHDEVNHLVPSFELYQGQGYIHNPVTHGPFQFHLIAGTFFLFGDSDFTARLPHAIFSIATIAFVLFAFKRYLGRTGALLAGVFFLISPFMLFYGRYARNEVFMALFAVVQIWAVLRYLEKGKTSSLYILATTIALMFITKENVYIYMAILLIFLAILFMHDVMQKEWVDLRQKNRFLIYVVSMLLMVAVALGLGVLEATGNKTNAATLGGLTGWAANNLTVLHYGLLASVGTVVLLLVAAIITLTRGLGWRLVRQIRSFDLLMLTGLIVIPQLTAMVDGLLGFNALDYSQVGLIRTLIVLIVLFVISGALGIFWRFKVWLVSMAIFFTLFVVFFTTFFTNGQGFFTGIVGGLGYWLSQQQVDRGTQPLYYYALVQIPMYEYLAVIGTIVAVCVAAVKKLFWTYPGYSPAHQPEAIQQAVQLPLELETEQLQPVEEIPQKLPVVPMLAYMAVMNLLAYSVAGEKMPWLTVHIALPMLLAAGWGIGYLVDRIEWSKLLNRKGILTLLLLPVFLTSLGATLAILFGPNQPFAGTELAQLQTTATFVFAVIGALASGWGLLKLLEDWESPRILALFFITFLGALTLQTARSAYQASFINYDNSKEFLVYAHGAPGQTEVLHQVEEISQRTVGFKDIKVAYIGDALYPYWWYFRDYPNKAYFASADITKEISTYPVVIVGASDYDKVQSILKDNYISSHYIRLWWPMESYDNLTWQRIWDAVKNPSMRQAIFDIWANKDYTLYAQLTNNPNLTLENWTLKADMYLFIQKDIVSQIWNYGTLPAQTSTSEVDPYQAYATSITPDRFFGTTGNGEGQLSGPRGIALAKDGTLYVVDSGNSRIEHFDQDGKLLNSWGTYASVDLNSSPVAPAPVGTFNQPYGIAIGPDGSVYVADTWNFRIEKFTADGQFITTWGVSGQGETPDAFWGPRGVAVDSNGHVYVTDTGNKRVVVFDADGKFITQFGTYGLNTGEFDEPVGITLDSSGKVYVADTWNQRIQVFEPDPNGTFSYLREWTVSGWQSQSVENKPFIAVDQSGNVFTVDADSFRALEFTSGGQIVRVWGSYSSGIDGFNIPSGIAVDAQGGVWVSDAGNNYILHYTMPTSTTVQPNATPPYPTASIPLTADPLTGNLKNPFGQAVYQLDLAKKEWVPIVPAAIAAQAPAGEMPVQSSGGEWILRNIDGDPQFTWNADLLLWVAAGPVISANDSTANSTTTH